MTMFSGESILMLDVKGRLAIPSRYRTRLAEFCAGQLVVTVGLGAPCLWIYPTPTFEDVKDNLGAMPALDRRATGLKRLLIGHATELEPDKHGRILVPPNLRARVGLDKRVALIGQVNKFELWSEDIWVRERDGLFDNVSELLEGGSESDALGSLVL